MSLVRPKSLTELVSEEIRGQIIAGQLDLGAQLSESKIAKELNVSRTPVREALNRLEIEGLLHVEPQRGSFVFKLAPHELAQLCDARACLETEALIQAFKSNPGELHKRLSACVEQMEDARAQNDDTRYLAQDTQFHQHFFDCAQNKFLNDAYQTIAPKMAAIRNKLGRHPEHMEKSFREHLELAELARAGDIDRALTVLKSHIDRKEGSYWSAETTA